MSEPSIEEIREALDGWEFLKELPEEINGFTLHQDRTIDGQVLNIASYSNDAVRCRLDITYTSETFDYVPVKLPGCTSTAIYVIFSAAVSALPNM